MTDWLERARAEISKRADQRTINTIEGSLTTVTIVANQAKSLEKPDDQGSNDCNDSGPSGQIQNFRAARSTALPTLVIDEIAERINSWLKATDNPPRNATGIWKDLAEETEDFALGVWAYPAVMTGWSNPRSSPSTRACSRTEVYQARRPTLSLDHRRRPGSHAQSLPRKA